MERRFQINIRCNHFGLHIYLNYCQEGFLVLAEGEEFQKKL